MFLICYYYTHTYTPYNTLSRTLTYTRHTAPWYSLHSTHNTQQTQLAFSTSLKVNSGFRNRISQLFHIPAADVRVVKVRPFKLQNLKAIPDLDWFGSALKASSTLGGFPWRWVSCWVVVVVCVLCCYCMYVCVIVSEWVSQREREIEIERETEKRIA